MLAGRDLLKAMKGKEKFVMTTPLLADSNGVKIGKSEGNVIGLTDPAPNLFGKIMALGDDAIVPLFVLLTDTPMEEINAFDIKQDPFNLKKRVASIIVEQLHGDEQAKDALEKFENTFSKGEFPDDAIVLEADKEEKLIDVLVKNKVVESKMEFRRLVEAGAVSDYPDKKITDSNELVGESERKIKIGKKTFVVIKPK